jgi:glycosyltransferase involved in cell wall biosynthesis
MDKIKISVIIPVYNVENYLRQCLDSITNQTLKEIEIICVNDGSTDTSLQILEEYAHKDGRIQIINIENSGIGAARKIGLDVSNGDFIAFVDSDDWVKLDAYEKLYSHAVLNHSDIVFFNTESYDENKDNYIFLDRYDIIKYFEDNKIDFKLNFNYKDIKPFVLNRNFAAWNKLYKSEFLKSYNDFYFPKHITFEDVPFHVQVMLRAKRISFCTEKLYTYRLSNINSKTNSSYKTRNIFNIFVVVDKVKDVLIDSNKMDEFQSEFNIFKIGQLYNWFEKCADIYKKEFFNLIRQEFENMNMGNNDINKLTTQTKNDYEYIMKSSSYREFELLEQIRTMESTYYNELRIHKQILNSRKQDYEKQLESKEQIINEISSSNSWKLTKPLRNLGNSLKKLK